MWILQSIGRGLFYGICLIVFLGLCIRGCAEIAEAQTITHEYRGKAHGVGVPLPDSSRGTERLSYYGYVYDDTNMIDRIETMQDFTDLMHQTCLETNSFWMHRANNSSTEVDRTEARAYIQNCQLLYPQIVQE